MRFVFFDLGNVIVNFSVERLLRQVAAVTDVNEARLKTLIYGEKLQFRHERGEIDETVYYETFCEGIGKRVPLEKLLPALCDIFTLNERILPVLDYFAGTDFPRGILSNTAPAHWEHCLRTYPVISRMIPSNYVLSYEAGEMKPYRRIYETAFQIASRAVPGIEKSQVLFIDDLEANIVAAAEFGFDGIVYRDQNVLVSELARRGVALPDGGMPK